MSREEEFKKVKDLIDENIEDANCGIYNSRNIVGDYMETIFDGKYFTLDMCYNYSYFELFGTTKEEWQEIKEYYEYIK